MGRFFTSFDEAWAAFLEREEPLEDFFGQFPEEEAYLTVWLAVPGEAVRAEARAVQRELEGLDGLRMTPPHWLHVSLGAGREDEVEDVRDRVRRFGSFAADYGPVNCFHQAHVLEVRPNRFAELARAVDPERDPTHVLPHLSVAYVSGMPPPEPSRERLIGLRGRPRVREPVLEIRLCVVPVGRAQLFRPWRVAAVVALDDG